MKNIISLKTEIFISNHLLLELQNTIQTYLEHQIFILLDENSHKFCLPLLNKIFEKNIKLILIKSGEQNKSFLSLTSIWKYLIKNNANRKSLLINFGGGVICDMGGFASATFKRGIDFINIPTTLLSQVDASVGGKLAINFEGFKNEIGLFQSPKKVFIDSQFLKTLDKKNILSGFAEMLKHALISDEKHLIDLMNFDLENINYKKFNELIYKSIQIKNHFVMNDFEEKNIRKTLNFGHTFGHAFESFFAGTKNELLHGEAVAYGIIAELFLSVKKLNFDEKLFFQIKAFFLKKYGLLKLNSNDFYTLIDLMKHDKKNTKNKINCTLLSEIGKAKINCFISEKEILECLELF